MGMLGRDVNGGLKTAIQTDSQPRVKTWDWEGSIQKCENRVPLPKLPMSTVAP